jgi:TolB-like protein
MIIGTWYKPSIAVLPFTNISNDPEQEVFVDGLTEDLITELSRNAELFVIARHSSFAYKGKSIDIRQIARELGVRYLLEGSARRANGRARINAQLIDALGGGHLWVERFDRSLEDIFAVQDEVTGKIVEALIGQLTAPLVRNRPATLEAYDLCVRGRALIGRSPEAGRESCLLMRQAIALDPKYAEAHRWLAVNLWAAWAHWGEPMEPNRQRAVTAAEKAVTLDPNDAGCRWVLGLVLAYERRWPESDTEMAVALELDPNNADAWAFLADISVWKGQPGAAVEQAQRALRLNPHPPGWYYLGAWIGTICGEPIRFCGCYTSEGSHVPDRLPAHPCRKPRPAWATGRSATGGGSLHGGQSALHDQSLDFDAAFPRRVDA